MSKRTAGASAALLLMAAAAALPAQVVQPESFVVRMGQDTFAVENFSRTADRLEAELVGPQIGRLRYTVAFGPAATVRELNLGAWAPGAAADQPAMQEVRLVAKQDSVIAEITTGGSTQTQRLGSQADAILYVNPSFALMEQVVLRARALGGTRVEVPMFMMQGGATLTAVVTWPAADSVVVSLAGQDMRAEVRPDGHIVSGAIAAQNLTFVRVAGAHVPPPALEPPDYSAPEGAPYTAEDVVVRTAAGHTLAGTLTRPAVSRLVPAVVMVTGSGPQDRDQAIPLIRGYRPFREIADTLSRRGIAVLRLDDRGFGASTGDFSTATSADFADDIRAALDYLRNRPDIDRRLLGLVGHSEGGLIGPMITATDTTLRALVVIAGPSQTGREIIEYQQRYAIEHSPAIPPESRDSALAAAAEQLQTLAERQPWLSFFLDHDPLPAARQVRHTPVLILHGATDRQVTPEQAKELAAAFRAAGNPDVTLHVFPDVNHLMVPDPDGNPAGYSMLTDASVGKDVLGTLADWVDRRLR